VSRSGVYLQEVHTTFIYDTAVMFVIGLNQVRPACGSGTICNFLVQNWQFAVVDTYAHVCLS